MKKTIILTATILMLIGGAAAQVMCYLAEPPGSIDDECQYFGFDYGIAKYGCGQTSPEEGDGSTLTVTWTDCVSVDWTADPAVAGVLSKEDGYECVYPGGTSGTITKSLQVDGKTYDISHITFCGEETTTTSSTTTTFAVPEVASGSLAALAIILASPAFAYLLIRKK